MATRLTQQAVEVLEEPSPQARITQQAIEVLLLENIAGSKVRLTQQAIEALLLPNTQRIRLTQIAVEICLAPPTITTVSPTPVFPAVWLTAYGAAKA
jgi:hypothetical protein